MAESTVTIKKTESGGYLVTSDGVSQTIPPSALENYLRSTAYARSQVSAPETIDELIRRHGGGVHITATGSYTVSPGLRKGDVPSSTETTTITPESITPETIPVIEKISGTKITQETKQTSPFQSLVNQAVQLASQGRGPDIMLTPQEYSQRIREYQELRRQALNPTLADILGYAVWDPFMIRTLSAGADAYFQGKSQQEVAKAMFESGMLAYKLQSYYDPVGSIVQSALGGMEIALISTAPTFLKSPLIRRGISTLGLGAGTYNLISEAYKGELKFSSTFINLATIGLSTAGIYSGFTELSQRKLIDPVLKDINVKEFHEVTVERVKYVPIYGKEINYEYLKGSEKFSKIANLEKGNIYGFPQEKPIEIKPHDLGVEIRYLESKRGIAKIETITFKVTEKGLEPLGEINLDRFYPSLKSKFAYLLEHHPIEYNFEIGFGEKLKIPATKPSQSFIEFDESIRKILSVKLIGIEKPLEYKPDVYMKSPNQIEKIIKLTGDATGLDLTKDLFSNLGIKDWRGLTPTIDLKSGTVTTNELLLAEKTTAIDFIKTTSTSKPISVDIVKSPVNLKFGVIPISLEITSNAKQNIANIIRNEKIDKVASQTKVTYSFNINQIEKPIVTQKFIPAQNQIHQTQPLKETIKISNAIFQAPILRHEKPIETSRIVTNEIRLPSFTRSTFKEPKIVITSASKSAKTLKISSFLKPTASMVSLEKAYVKYGHGTLARGPKIEKIFRNLARSSGLATEFPASEFLKGGKRR